MGSNPQILLDKKPYLPLSFQGLRDFFKKEKRKPSNRQFVTEMPVTAQKNSKLSLPIDAEVLCNYILFRCKKKRIKDVGYGKLQRLAYYCHAWHLVHFKKPLLKQGFGAWILGPASQEIYDIYEDNEDTENLTKNNLTDNSDIIPESLQEIVDSVLDVYGKFTKDQLGELARNQEPWKKAKGNEAFYEPTKHPIPDQVIRKYYADRIAE